MPIVTIKGQPGNGVPEIRVLRVVSSQKVGEKVAKQKIIRFDTCRREFIKKYFKVELADTIYCDGVINPGHLTCEDAAFVIANTLSRRGPAAGN